MDLYKLCRKVMSLWSILVENAPINGVFIEACFRSVFRDINDIEKRASHLFSRNGGTLCCKRLIWDNLTAGCGLGKRNWANPRFNNTPRKHLRSLHQWRDWNFRKRLLKVAVHTNDMLWRKILVQTQGCASLNIRCIVSLFNLTELWSIAMHCSGQWTTGSASMYVSGPWKFHHSILKNGMVNLFQTSPSYFFDHCRQFALSFISFGHVEYSNLNSTKEHVAEVHASEHVRARNAIFAGKKDHSQWMQCNICFGKKENGRKNGHSYTSKFLWKWPGSRIPEWSSFLCSCEAVFLLLKRTCLWHVQKRDVVIMWRIMTWRRQK